MTKATCPVTASSDADKLEAAILAVRLPRSRCGQSLPEWQRLASEVRKWFLSNNGKGKPVDY